MRRFLLVRIPGVWGAVPGAILLSQREGLDQGNAFQNNGQAVVLLITLFHNLAFQFADRSDITLTIPSESKIPYPVANS